MKERVRFILIPEFCHSLNTPNKTRMLTQITKRAYLFTFIFPSNITESKSWHRCSVLVSRNSLFLFQNIQPKLLTMQTLIDWQDWQHPWSVLVLFHIKDKINTNSCCMIPIFILGRHLEKNWKFGRNVTSFSDFLKCWSYHQIRSFG